MGARALRLFVVGRLFALFVVASFLELYLLLGVGRALGFWPTIALIVLTAALGAFLAKREGLRVWQKWREALAHGEMPEEGVLGGVLVLLGGVLLIAPGVLSDLVGLALLVPPSRRRIAKLVQKRLEARVAAPGSGFHYRVVQIGGAEVLHGFGRSPGMGADVIEVEGEVVAERRRGEPKARLES